MHIRLADGLRTDRLTLRPWRTDEGTALLDLLGRGDVNRYLYTAPRTTGELDGLIGRRVGPTDLHDVGDAVYLAVEQRADEVVVGEVLLILRSVQHRGAEFGAVFHPAHQGHGFAAEAGVALLTEGFDQGLHRIYARCDSRNAPSIALMERLGMRREGYLVQNEFVKGRWTDEVRCAVLAAEYATRGELRLPG
ncbi:GNAT family N-acetyltransferase [uncultured Jatrophihabitans sp.]|uniref:GNAT family N-acetyltransferase n=1 Tax=uncultured Jatrophihabitans sp. TaxID=1610747 RepID=UPI0035CA6BFE